MEIDTLVSDWCLWSNENYFSVLPAQSITTIQHQVCEAKSRNKDICLLGMLTAGQHEEEIPVMLVTLQVQPPRDCTTLLHTVKGHKVCRVLVVVCAVCV